MQTEAEAFLQRIRAFPDDDTPRLIFADWLEEQGDVAATARARLIRVQIALARLEEEEADLPPGAPGRAEREAARVKLVRAERELFGTYRPEWTAAFGPLGLGLEFRRGFVEKANVDARDLVRQAHELFAAAPLRHIQLLNVGGSYAAALQCPYLSRLSAFTIHAQHVGEPLARAVARSPHLAGLKVLHLTRNRFEDDAAEHLAGSPVLANLEELDLSENELGETVARALAASSHLGNVRRLELAQNRLGPAGAEALAGSERLASLHRLGLSGNEIGSARLHALSRAHDLLRVPVLILSANGLTAAGLQVILTRAPGTVRVRELDLSHNDLGSDGARVLAASPQLANLRLLRLTGCGVGDDGVRALAESPHLNELVTLDLTNNPAGDPGFRAFMGTPYMRSLRALFVPSIGVSSRLRGELDRRHHLPRS